MFSGKSTIARLLEERLGYVVVSARETLRELAGDPLVSRTDLQIAGVAIEDRTKGRWLAEAAAAVYSASPSPIVVDSARTQRQVEAVQEYFPAVVHVHLSAPADVVRKRFERHADDLIEPPSFEEAVGNAIENEALRLGDRADFILDSGKSSPETLFKNLTAVLSREA
jgi:predicted kinase